MKEGVRKASDDVSRIPVAMKNRYGSKKSTEQMFLFVVYFLIFFVLEWKRHLRYSFVLFRPYFEGRMIRNGQNDFMTFAGKIRND